MKDRLIFDTAKLDNGITVYSYPMDVPFVDARIAIPFGSAHNVAPIRPGSFHFLEHMVLNRSKMFPELDSFFKYIGLNGGGRGASTYLFKTVYEMEIRKDLFKESFKGFLSQIFEPIFTSEDVQNEIGVIKNERRRKERFFPGDDRLSKYLLGEWTNDPFCPMTQRLGSDLDLEAMTCSEVLDIHNHYFTDQARVFIGGSFEIDLVYEELSKIRTKKVALPEDRQKISWKNREYHEGKFDDVNRYTYFFGGLHESPVDFKTEMAIGFILSLLNNNVHGSIFNWLRNEKGWVYEISDSLYADKYGLRWNISFPVNNRQQVEIIRKELPERIVLSLNDQDLVGKEINRVKSKKLFGYQTIDKILDAGVIFAVDKSKIYSETELVSSLESFADTKYLMEIYEKHMSPAVTGEFLAIPE